MPTKSNWIPICIPPKDKKEYMVKNILGKEAIAFWNGLFFIWQGVDLVLSDVIAYKEME